MVIKSNHQLKKIWDKNNKTTLLLINKWWLPINNNSNWTIKTCATISIHNKFLFKILLKWCQVLLVNKNLTMQKFYVELIWRTNMKYLKKELIKIKQLQRFQFYLQRKNQDIVLDNYAQTDIELWMYISIILQVTKRLNQYLSKRQFNALFFV